eukprot:PITA_23761
MVYSFKALVENQIGKKIKIWRTDNGIEYESNEFIDYCREVGIKRETTTTYTPMQNGVVERNNRTIIKATHAMFHDQGLPKFLWEKLPTSLCMFKQMPTSSIGLQDTRRSIHQKGNDDDARKQDEPPTDDSMPDVEALTDPIDPPPSEPSTSRKRPLWLKDTLENVEKHTAPRRTFCESKKPNKYQGYLASMSTIVQSKPCTFEEAMKHQVWKDAMNEKYESIMKNDV